MMPSPAPRAPAARLPPACRALPPPPRAADPLPLDPRLWSRRDVGAWAGRMGARPERFPMNGKALCLMSGAMFAAREPGLAERLHLDFRRRLAKALALQELLERLTGRCELGASVPVLR